MKAITLETINNIFWASYPFGRGFKHTADNDAIVDALNAMNTTEDEIVEYTSTKEFLLHEHGYHALRGLYKYIANKRGDDAPKKAPRKRGKADAGKGGKGEGESKDAPKADGEGKGEGESGESEDADGGEDADGEGEGKDAEGKGGADGKDGKDADGKDADGEGKDGGADGDGDGDGDGEDGEGKDAEDKDGEDKKDAPKEKKDAAEKAVHEKMRACLNVLTVAESPLLMVGPAGSGKSFMAAKIAEACGADEIFTQSKVSFETDLKGFMDSHNRYSETSLYRAMKRASEGKKTAFFLDEIFGGDTSCLIVINDLLSDGEMTFPNGEKLSAENLIIMAADNTSGNGADNKYNNRNKADKSFINRFGVVHVDYDKRVEKKLADGVDGLLDFIYAVRAAAEHVDIDIVCSYRTIKGMAKYAKAGIDPKEAVDAFVYQDALTDDDKDTLRCDAKIERLIAKGNVYALAM